MFTQHGWLFSICLAGSLASFTPPECGVSRCEARGDPLSDGARARLGTHRFRVGDAGGCLAVSPDGTTLASGGGSTVRFWDQATGAERRSVGLPVLQIFFVAFSPNNKYFTALGDHMSMISRPIGDVIDNSVFVGEVAGGKVLRQFRGRYTSAVFSADSERLFIREGNVFRDAECPLLVWDLPDGKKTRRFSAVRSFALSPDGKILAGGDKNGVIHLWEPKLGTELGQLKGHGSPVQALAFSPDGGTLVSASGDRSDVPVSGDQPPPPRDHGIRIWDLTSGRERRQIRCAHANFRWLRFAPDGKTFASKDDSGDLSLWDAQMGRLRQRFPSQRREIGTVFFSPDGKFLFYEESSDRPEEPVIVQWDIAAGKEARRWRTDERWLKDVLMAPDGKTLFCLGDSIRAWDTASGKERNIEPDHRTAIQSMTFSPDGKRLATVDKYSRLRTWDAVRGSALPSLSAARVARCAFTSDGRLFLWIATDATVELRDVPSGRILRRFRIGGAETVRLWAQLTNSREGDLDLWSHPSTCCVLGPDNRILAVVHEDQCIHLWDLRRGEELRRLEGHRGRIHELVFTPDGKGLFSRGEDRTIRWWNVGDGTEIERFQEDGSDPACFSLSRDGRLLAWASGARIHLYDLVRRKEVRQWKGHADSTFRILFGLGDTMLASTGDDQSMRRTIRCWNVGTGREHRSLTLTEYQREIDLLVSPGERLLAHYSMDPKNSQFALHELASGCEVCQTRTYAQERFALAPDGHTVVMNRAKWVTPPRAIQDDPQQYPVPIRLADELVFLERTGGAVIAEVSAGHRGGISCLAFSPDSQTLATGGEDTIVQLWDWRRLVGLTGDGRRPKTDSELASAWAALADSDARKAYRAVGTLAAAGDKVVPFLRERLGRATAGEPQRWGEWVSQLDANDFSVRKKATQALTRLGVEAELFLRRAAAEKVTLETRRRLEQILAGEAMKRPSGDSLRKVRAALVLETLSTPSALELLAEWSRGRADDWLTQEAHAALRRARPKISSP